MIFLDANVILRFILDNDPHLSPKAKAIFEKIDRGEIKVDVTLLTISEVAFTLERSYKLLKSEITDRVLGLIKSPNINFEKHDLLPKILILYVEKNISFIDAYHAVLMNKNKIKKIYSFDRDFDKISTIQRLEK
ncbi:hypothetical protein A2617_01210 [Candidatus Daviesbacteria bacterium RIFOXYD1_FULL_41_10]|uniref:PIN domain-containing protein n=2 Tax=Candidatus Daviesiibacteriota TaxID=1752718 RepID=A0A1F5N085_9BACT|nr:MAG: PilT protein domain protein [Candidatus Daviesbacteria bacterium GW2011_GWB1_41_5]OGE71047.1 MAG: hypothetical protein A2617_01210 [Candidatus Daviesbacteria bacterium RIFOXYD1_FULL_41_10]